MITDLSQNFFRLLQAGYHNSPFSGTCQFVIAGDEGERFHLTLGGDSLTFSEGEHPSPTAVVHMPEPLLEKIVAQPHLWDARDPAILANVRMSGDLRLVAFLSELAKRPSTAVERIFRETEESARTAAPLSAVERVERPSEEQVLSALRESRPLVATGCLTGEEWSWGFDDLKARFGHLPLRRKAGSGEAETVREFIDSMENAADGAHYTSGVVLPAAMWHYFQIPFFKPNAYGEPQIWMGSRTGDVPCTDLHRDSSHGLLGQLVGRKRILLYSPADATNLYPAAAFNTYQPCHVRPWDPDHEAYPRFARAKALEVVLHPGDLLVNPAGWFHCVFALDPVLSVSRFMNWQVWEKQLR